MNNLERYLERRASLRLIGEGTVATLVLLALAACSHEPTVSPSSPKQPASGLPKGVATPALKDEIPQAEEVLLASQSIIANYPGTNIKVSIDPANTEKILRDPQVNLNPPQDFLGIALLIPESYSTAEAKKRADGKYLEQGVDSPLLLQYQDRFKPIADSTSRTTLFLISVSDTARAVAQVLRSDGKVPLTDIAVLRNNLNFALSLQWISQMQQSIAFNYNRSAPKPIDQQPLVKNAINQTPPIQVTSIHSDIQKFMS